MKIFYVNFFWTEEGVVSIYDYIVNPESNRDSVLLFLSKLKPTRKAGRRIKGQVIGVCRVTIIPYSHGRWCGAAGIPRRRSRLLPTTALHFFLFYPPIPPSPCGTHARTHARIYLSLPYLFLLLGFSPIFSNHVEYVPSRFSPANLGMYLYRFISASVGNDTIMHILLSLKICIIVEDEAYQV